MSTHPNTALGISLNITASVLFALMFAYTSLLGTLAGTEIYGWRIVLTIPCLTLFIWLKGNSSQVVVIYRRFHQERFFFLTRILSSFLIGIQLWLFMWTPSHGYGLDVSLGYFMMPISMVIVGRIAFKERMSRFQQLSCIFAVLGILNLLAISQTLSWPTLLICLGYPIYFWLRQKTETNNIGGLWFDMILSLPVCIFFIMQGSIVTESLSESSHMLWLISGLGLISALALAFQSLSAPHLNLSLFGLLVYVEPILLVAVSIALGESITSAEWPTYIAIWLAVFTLMLEGLRSFKKNRKLAT